MCRCLPSRCYLRGLGLSMKLKFTLIDYLIIILVICAVVFAFIHITTDDSSDLHKTAFDISTASKIPDTYLDYYKDGYIIKSTVEGTNATTGEEVTLNGTVKWIDDTARNDVRMLIESGNQTYLIGAYKNIPNADIYMDTVTLETDGSKYNNLVEFKIKPMEINSLSDLNKNLPHKDYDISTRIAVDSLDVTKIQELTNKLNSDNERLAIIMPNINSENQIELIKADEACIKDANSILGDVKGITTDITVRVYDCNESQIDQIKNNYEVTNVRTF